MTYTISIIAGSYTTKEGQIYTGEWDGDKLVENADVEILYPGGVKYYGPLVKNKYTGKYVIDFFQIIIAS